MPSYFRLRDHDIKKRTTTKPTSLKTYSQVQYGYERERASISSRIIPPRSFPYVRKVLVAHSYETRILVVCRTYVTINNCRVSIQSFAVTTRNQGLSVVTIRHYCVFLFYFIPLINRPARITCQSATLIDNIFTNDMISNLVPSILCSDVSDHLPVFVTSSVKIPCKSDQFIYKRMYSDNI